MSVFSPRARVAPPPAARRAAGATILAAGAAVVVWIIARVMANSEPPSPLLVAGGALAALAAVALVLVRFEAAVSLGLVLLAVVRFQPAPTDAVLALVIAAALLSGRFRADRVPSLIIALLGGLLALNLISAVDSISLGKAAVFFTITLYLAVFAIWLTSYVNSRRRARQVFIAYLAAALISAALGILAVLLPIPGRSAMLFLGRAEALFKDPNVFGPFLVPALLMLLAETVSPRLLRASRPTKLVGVSVLALGVLFSYSRGAWLNLVVGLVIMLGALLLRRRSARTAGRLLVVLFVAIAIGGVVIAATGAGGFLQERAHLQAYDTSRLSAQTEGISLGERHPIGIGPGQFDVIEPLSSHNLYVRVFAEQGPLGLLLLLALVLATLAFAARNVVHGRDTYGIDSAALLGAWCGALVNSGLIDTLHWRHLWLVAALIWAGAARGAQPAASPAAPRAIHPRASSALGSS
jgi:O-antigen ligase